MVYKFLLKFIEHFVKKYCVFLSSTENIEIRCKDEAESY